MNRPIIAEVQRGLSVRGDLLARLRQQGTQMFRLFHGDGEGVPGLAIDAYGTAAVIQEYDQLELAADDLNSLGKTLMQVPELGLRTIYHKRYRADRTGASAADSLRDPRPLMGEAVEDSITVEEQGKRFLVRLYDGYSTGIFLDQRANRAWIAERCTSGTRMLNLFAYTCGFSVYAAAAGSSTVNIDVSGRYLGWGKQNFEANGISLDSHRFFAEDARSYAQRAHRRGELFDVIVADPPTFGRDKKGKVFRVEHDFYPLLEILAELLTPGGVLFASSNYSMWKGDSEGPRFFDRRLEVLDDRLPGIPEDFPGRERPIWCGAWQKKS